MIPNKPRKKAFNLKYFIFFFIFISIHHIVRSQHCLPAHHKGWEIHTISAKTPDPPDPHPPPEMYSRSLLVLSSSHERGNDCILFPPASTGAYPSINVLHIPALFFFPDESFPTAPHGSPLPEPAIRPANEAYQYPSPHCPGPPTGPILL